MAEYFGWIEDKDEVDLISSTLPFPLFGDTDANSVTDLPDRVMPWLIKVLPARNQGNVGSCVSFGTARPIEYVALMENNAGDKQQLKSLSREVIYGGSRVEIGGGRFRGQDGSTGAWGSAFVNKYGTIAEEVYNIGDKTYDLRTYSVSRCRDYGNNGVPDALEPLLEPHQIKTITKVTSAEQAIKSMANGYFINVCSNVGFNTRRDSNGICKSSGVWNHSMSVIGYKKFGDSTLFCIENSWGISANSGPIVDLPHGGCFWIDMKTMDRMLSQGDSWSYSDYEGFPVKKLDWVF